MPDEVIFAVGHQNKNMGSAKLRGFQLEAIVHDGLADLGWRSRVHVGPCDSRHAKIIITKSYILDYGMDEIMRLCRADNEIIIDPVDWNIDPAILSLAHRVLASSYEQWHYLNNATYLEAPIFFVPHHVDTRIGSIHCQTDHFQLGYFGAPRHAKLLDGLFWKSRPCDIIAAKKPDDTRWMARLKSYNCHYLFRQDEPTASVQFKPFLKGYIAAHCGAVVLAAANDAEAVFNLGADYPFLFDTRNSADIRRAICQASASFNDSSWAEAQKRMTKLRDVYGIDPVKKSLIAALT